MDGFGQYIPQILDRIEIDCRDPKAIPEQFLQCVSAPYPAERGMLLVKLTFTRIPGAKEPRASQFLSCLAIFIRPDRFPLLHAPFLMPMCHL